ncbi:MAG: shikimate dehydrogenase [Nanoarchaeota archaeon]
MLAAVVTAKTYKEAIREINNIQNADLIELRLDYIKDLSHRNIKNLIKMCKKPAIATNRKKDEGGLFTGSEEDRIDALQAAIKSDVNFVDVEYSTDKNLLKHLLKNKSTTRIIISHHNLYETPKNIINVYNKMKKLNPDFIKIVTKAKSVTDNFEIFDLINDANKEKTKVIAFCSGSYGEFSRILSIILGSQITYAANEKGKESADGQLTLNEMHSYRIKKLNNQTKILGIIGNPVTHSLSNIMHNAAFEKLNINAVYLKFKVDNLKHFVNYFKGQNILGFSVTIPHKIEIVKFIDNIDKKAEKIGAVNTIVVKNKRLIGHNTDCDGAIKALKTKTELKNKKVVVLGAGGSSRAVAYGLKEERANTTILNRTVESARNIADCFDCSYGSLNDLKKIDYDILINTTPVGMHPYPYDCPIPSRLLRKDSIIFDIVFNPYKTKLLKYAEKKECTVIPGFEMLINGAELQFKLWTKKNAPTHLMREKAISYLEDADHQN